MPKRMLLGRYAEEHLLVAHDYHLGSNNDFYAKGSASNEELH